MPNGEDAACAALGIPSHLHQLGRPADQQFADGELLYRRVPENIALIGQLVPPEAFTTRSMSVNRERYSNAPEDVLYNVEDGRHYTTWGVVAFTVGLVRSLSRMHPQIKNMVFTLAPVHAPIRCMYPHTEIEVRGNGERLGEIKPASVRTWIKSRIAEGSTVTRRPAGAG
jgi:hypothetical protein